MSETTKCTWNGQIRHPHIQGLRALYPRTAVSIIWAYEVRIVSLDSELALLDMGPVFLHNSAVNHADQVQKS
eukprot:4086797-Pyramimonas_sp.AAC.1